MPDLALVLEQDGRLIGQFAAVRADAALDDGSVLPQAVQNKMLHTARAVNIPECIPHKALHGAVVGRHFLPDGH